MLQTEPNNATSFDLKNKPKFEQNLKKSFPVWLDPQWQRSNLTRENINLNKPIKRARLFALHHLLTEAECQYYIEQADQAGFESIDWEYHRDYRDCTRLLAYLPELAKTLWQRLQMSLTTDDLEGVRPYGVGNEGVWIPCGVNPCFRFSRYEADGHFDYHRDGSFVQDDQTQSIYTLMIYLNQNFKKGQTKFVDLPSKTSDRRISLTVDPESGKGLIFNHDVWHCGDWLNDGIKYILRTDLMFRKLPNVHRRDARTLMGGPEYDLYLEAQKWYYKSIQLQKACQPEESTKAYLKAQELQLQLPSLPDSNQASGLSDRLTESLYEFPLAREEILKILRYLSLEDLSAVAQANLALSHRVNDGEFWRQRYADHYGVSTSQLGDLITNHWKSVFQYRIEADWDWRPVIFYFTDQWTYILRFGDLPVKEPTKIAMVCGHYWCRGSGHENCLVGREVDRSWWGANGQTYGHEGLWDGCDDDEERWDRPPVPEDQQDDLQPPEPKTEQTGQLNELLLQAFFSVYMSRDWDTKEYFDTESENSSESEDSSSDESEFDLSDDDIYFGNRHQIKIENDPSLSDSQKKAKLARLGKILEKKKKARWEPLYDHWNFHWEQEVRRRPVIIIQNRWMNENRCDLIRQILFEKIQVPYLYFYPEPKHHFAMPNEGEVENWLCMLMDISLVDDWRKKFEVNQSVYKMF